VFHKRIRLGPEAIEHWKSFLVLQHRFITWASCNTYDVQVKSSHGLWNPCNFLSVSDLEQVIFHLPYCDCIYSVWKVLIFELRAFHLLIKCSKTWAIPQSFCLLFIFQIRSYLCQRPALDQYPPTFISLIAMKTDM
jgi:hypothetical protein